MGSFVKKKYFSNRLYNTGKLVSNNKKVLISWKKAYLKKK